MQAFFCPFCPHSLILVQLKSNSWQVYKQHGPGEIFTLCSDSDIPRAGKGLLEQAASVSLPCQSFQPPAAPGSVGAWQGNARLPSAPFQLSLFYLYFAIHPAVQQVWATAHYSMFYCSMFYLMLNIKFRGFPPLIPGEGAWRQGLIFACQLKGQILPTVTAQRQASTAEAKVQTGGLVCRYVESLWHTSYLTDGKLTNASDSLMPQC